MKKQFLCAWAVTMSFALSVFCQGNVEKVQHPTEAEIAQNKRTYESLLHPTFIRLRLVSELRASPPEEPTTTPSAFTIDQLLHFEMLITQNSTETLFLSNYMWPYYEYRPELIANGDMVAYSKKAQEQVERVERNPARNGSMVSMKLVPGLEVRGYSIKLEDWYESPLPPGHYQLIVRKRFRPDGDWVESNPVTFDVITRRTPSQIPEGVSLRLVPEGSKPPPQGQPYRLGYDEGIAVELVNDSNERVPILVVDHYYGHRPQLFKDGKLIPYNDETAKQIESREKDTRLVAVTTNLYLDPKTTARLDGFSLKQWYAPLAPGLYRLTDRRRFEIDGPWTKDSPELIFEIAP